MADNCRSRAEFAFESYHLAWLSAHPWRSAQWLKDRLGDGFHIHHMDGNHDNDDPSNLILVDGADHLRLHGVSIRSGIDAWRAKERKKAEILIDARNIYQMKASKVGTWSDVARSYYDNVKVSPKTWSEHGTALSNRARSLAKAEGLAWPPR